VSGRVFTTRQKRAAVRRMLKGVPVSAVAAELKLNASTAYAWRARFAPDGRLIGPKKTGGRRSADEKLEDAKDRAIARATKQPVKRSKREGPPVREALIHLNRVKLIARKRVADGRLSLTDPVLLEALSALAALEGGEL
jgi:transposase